MYRLFRLLLALLSLCVYSSEYVFALPIGQATAAQIAQQVLRGKTSARSLQHLQLTERPTYYIYNVGNNGGFALIAKDDTHGAVIGYSDQGTFDLERMSPELRDLFSILDEVHPSQIAKNAARSFDYPPKHSRVVAPLLRSRWNQDHPYSLYTPTYKDTDGDEQHAFAGCVAVAMAQLMYYHQWPAQGRGEKYHPKLGKRDFSTSHYRWSDMRPIYGDNERYIGSGKNPRVRPDDDPMFTSVAELMRDLGAAVSMNYQPAASSSNSELAASALQTYFDYEATDALSTSRLGIDKTEQLITEELIGGFPVYISGMNKSGGNYGHAWVIDGIDSFGRFHMNFGWGGQSDGYYSLRHIAPATAGAEFSGKQVNFTRSVQIILAHPKRTGTAPLPEGVKQSTPQLSGHATSTLHLHGAQERKQARQNAIDVDLSGFINNSGTLFSGDYGYGLYNEQGQLLRIYPSKYHREGGFTKVKHRGAMVDGQYIDEEYTETDRLDITGLPSGIYALRPMSAYLSKEGKWSPWVVMQEAATLGLRLTDSEVEVIEEDGLNRGFQIMEPLQQPSICAGDQLRLPLVLKNLMGTTPSTKITLLLYDKANKLVEGFQVADPVEVEFQPMETQLLHLPLTLPESIPAGRYRLALEVKKAQEEGEYYPTQLYQLTQETYLTVSESITDRVQAIDARLIQVEEQENTSETPTDKTKYKELTSYPVDLNTGRDIYLAVDFKTPPAIHPLGRVQLYLEDPSTGERILCGTQSLGSPSTFYTMTATLKSDALNQHLSGKFITGRTYRVVAEITQDGRTYNAWAPDERTVYVSFITEKQEGVAPTPEVHPAESATTPAPTPEPQPAPKPKPEPPAPAPAPTPAPTPKPKPEEQPEPKPAPIPSEEIQEPSLRYFPAESRVEVFGKQLLRLEVFDLMGKRLILLSLSGVQQASQSLATLPRAIYLVRVLDGASYTTYRLAR